MVILCTIDLETREVSLPAGQVIASYDHNVDVIRFQAEAIPGFSLDTSSIKIAAQGPNKARHDYAVDPSTVQIEEETGYITFDWPIPAGVTEMPLDVFKYGDKGQLIFAVCAEIIDGSTVSKAWHSDDGIITVVAHLEPESGGGEDPEEEATNAQKIGQLQTATAILQREISGIASGTPPTVDSTDDMDHEVSTVYINTTDGKWYYWDGSAWQIGGVYGGAVTSTTFNQHGVPADDFEVGKALAEKADADDLTALTTIVAGKADSADVEILSDTTVKKNVINRFDPTTIHDDVFVNISTGADKAGTGFFASDYIYIGDLTSVVVSYAHLFGWYDSNKTWLGHPESMNCNSADRTYEVPEGAVYLRFSNYYRYLDGEQIGESVSRDDYVAPGDFTIEGYNPFGTTIVVDANGGGDYTSFTQAMYETRYSQEDVIVKHGTYDIVAEYVAIFGQEAVDSVADSDSATFDGFQRGIMVDNRKVVFEPGAHLVCDWTGHTVNGTHRFCALDVGINAEIIGLDLLCKGTWYCIHDDRGTNDAEYTNKYENCRVIGQSLGNSNCIGGGCKKYSRTIINNCYLHNNSVNGTTLRYHNTNVSGAEPEIFVSNTYINNTFTPRYYGSQTDKMRVYVNNCEAVSIHKLAESSGAADNVELYKWCCIETNPVTA